MNKEDWMIYEATDKVVKMLDVLCDPDTDPEVVKDTLEMVEADFADAAEDYCKEMANRRKLAEGIDAEAKRLSAKAKALKTGIERMESRMQQCLVATGKRKLETQLFTLSLRKSTSVEIDNLEDVPFECLKFTDPTADKTKIKDYIKKNGPVTWAHIAEHDNINIK